MKKVHLKELLVLLCTLLLSLTFVSTAQTTTPPQPTPPSVTQPVPPPDDETEETEETEESEATEETATETEEASPAPVPTPESPTVALPTPGDELTVIQYQRIVITRAEFNRRFEIAIRNIAAQQGIPLDDTIRAQLEALKPNYLDQLATELVLLEEAEARGIEVTAAEIDAQIEEVRANIGDEAAFSDLLSEAGFTDETQLRMLLRENELIQRLIEQLREEVTVDEDAIEAFYEENRAQLEIPEQVCARHILVETEEEAEEILGLLEDDGDFAELAAERSEDPGSAARGGDLGCIPRGRTVPPFEEAAFGAELDEVVGPVESQFGYHLIEVYERQEASVVPLEEVREQIVARLQDEGLNERIIALREGADVQTYPENLDIDLPAPIEETVPAPIGEDTEDEEGEDTDGTEGEDTEGEDGDTEGEEGDEDDTEDGENGDEDGENDEDNEGN